MAASILMSSPVAREAAVFHAEAHHSWGGGSKEGELNFREGCFMDFQVSKIHSGEDPCISSCLREIYCQPPEVVVRKGGGGTGNGLSPLPISFLRKGIETAVGMGPREKEKGAFATPFKSWKFSEVQRPSSVVALQPLKTSLSFQGDGQKMEAKEPKLGWRCQAKRISRRDQPRHQLGKKRALESAQRQT